MAGAPLIVSRQKGFGYVHAAKCGGSTVRAQLRQLDDLDGRFYGSIDHPELGHVNGNHLPLAVLERHFPEAYTALRSVRSYMLCREPLARFVSGVAQWLRSEKGREPADLSRAEVEAAGRALIDELRAGPGPTRRDLVYFVPQVAYAELRDERVIDAVIPLERIDLLFDALSARHGVALMRDSVWNPTVTYRARWLAPALRRAARSARRGLPTPAYARLRDAGVALFTRRGAPAFEAALRDLPGLTAFVADHYAADTEMHRAALAAHAAEPPDTIRRVENAH